jgi:Domain of unknown function (DUF4169)
MGDVVNLRLKRKAKTRSEDADKAAQNRTSFGRFKAEKTLTAARNAKAKAALGGHKRED